MSEIAEYERRITAALERAGKVIEQLSAAQPEDQGNLAAELEAERMANAQLEERVRAIKEKQETTVARLEGEVAKLSAALKSRDAEVQSMRAVNEELRQSNGALRDANAKGLGDAALVNGAMAGELESLRALRAADRAEIDEILGALEPMLAEDA